MDDECDSSEVQLAVRRLCGEPELRDKWRRYHLIGAVIAGQAPVRLPVDLAARVRAAVDAETDIAVAPAVPAAGASAYRWRRPMVSLAAAASLALAVGLGLVVVRQDDAPGTALAPAGSSMAQQLPAAVPADQGAGSELAALTPSPSRSLQPAGDRAVPAVTTATPEEVLDRINGYILNHSEYASVNGAYGVLPYMRMTSFSGGR